MKSAKSAGQWKSLSWFPSFAKWVANASASPAVFAIAVGTVIIWAATGPIFAYSDTWQLVINTGCFFRPT